MTDFTDRDLSQLKERGLEFSEGARQLSLLRNPPPFRNLDRACVPGDGVLQLDDKHLEYYQGLGRRVADQGRVSRFVPASGAA